MKKNKKKVYECMFLKSYEKNLLLNIFSACPRQSLFFFWFPQVLTCSNPFIAE